jgi:dynein heavy chain
VDPSIIPTQMSKDEQTHIYEECRHVFGFYNQKCIEALQKTTRISLDTLRARTEEPQVSKRNPSKILNRIPLLTADLTLTIPTIQLKPAVNDLQAYLTKSINLINESLKRVVIWGQRRQVSFDARATDPYYKDPSRGQDDAQTIAFPRLMPADAYRNKLPI